MTKVVVGAVAALGLLGGSASAQSSAGFTDVPDRFQVDAGYFGVSADTKLHFDGVSDVDFERDLAVDQDATTFWIDGMWRLGRRHQVELAFTRVSRDGQGFELLRDISWGGITYPAGIEATGTSSSNILGGYYRFAAFRNDRFEIGPTVGLGHLSIEAGIRATVNVGSQSVSFDNSASTGSITGAVGGYASGWATRRFWLHGDFLYMKVTLGDTEASVTDWRLGADYYFFKNAGLGVQYKYDRFRYEHGILSSAIGGEVAYEGLQAFASFRF